MDKEIGIEELNEYLSLLMEVHEAFQESCLEPLRALAYLVEEWPKIRVSSTNGWRVCLWNVGWKLIPQILLEREVA